jgi:hypothetical protein
MAHIQTYRGYQLYLGEQVDIYQAGERIDTVFDLATATQTIDEWMDAR